MRISFQKMKDEFYRVLLSHGFPASDADLCADIFSNNSLDGIYSHGVNRFARFITYVDEGVVKVNNKPQLLHRINSLEQWNGNAAAGPLNALFATDAALRLAKQHGIGCVGLSNTNHWMRGGAYGWKAAREGFVMIAFTNTSGVMPAWGAKDARLGNDPMVIAVPFGDEAVVLDMAMSQYSYGAMETAAMKKEQLGVPGGYDEEGQITTDPGAIYASRRPLPIGYWKGSGLALMLDILATILSGGKSTHEISKEKETGVSQVFIAIDISKLKNYPLIQSSIENIIKDYHDSLPVNEKSDITYPGERVLRTRKKNTEAGIPVEDSIWNEILQL